METKTLLVQLVRSICRRRMSDGRARTRPKLSVFPTTTARQIISCAGKDCAPTKRSTYISRQQQTKMAAPTNSIETYCTFTLAADVTAGGLPSEEDIAKDLESSDDNVRGLW